MPHSLAESLQRILVQDRAAIIVTAVFVALQLLAPIWVRRYTWTPLELSRQQLDRIVMRLRSNRKNGQPGASEDAETGVLKANPRAARAWDLSVGAPERDALEPELAFAPSRLLPREYNPRLEQAAPGLFTAFGIMGTFVG